MDFLQSFTAEPTPVKTTTSAPKMPTPSTTTELTRSEALGLKNIASRARTWSLERLTSYYKGLKVHGKAVGTISRHVKGKSSIEVEAHYNNWNGRYPPMEQWLSRFDASALKDVTVTSAGVQAAVLSGSETLGLQVVVPRAKTWSLEELTSDKEKTSGASDSEVPKMPTPSTTTELTRSETLGLQDLASRAKAWSLEQLHELLQGAQGPPRRVRHDQPASQGQVVESGRTILQ